MNYKKFEEINYANDFASKISTMHQLVENGLKKVLNAPNYNIIDIGGAHGIGAQIIDKLGQKGKFLNLEPTNNINEKPDLKNLDYISIQSTFQNTLEIDLPFKADLILMVSAAHEIALSYGQSNKKNKTLFFRDLHEFISQNSKRGALLAIGFPNYAEEASNEEIKEQRLIVDEVLGHSHPKEEYFTIEEFSSAFSSKPMFYEQIKMVLPGQKASETKLRANFAVFKI